MKYYDQSGNVHLTQSKMIMGDIKNLFNVGKKHCTDTFNKAKNIVSKKSNDVADVVKETVDSSCKDTVDRNYISAIVYRAKVSLTLLAETADDIQSTDPDNAIRIRSIVTDVIKELDTL